MLYIEAEIEELEKVLPEVKEKLADMEQMKKDSKEKLLKLKVLHQKITHTAKIWRGLPIGIVGKSHFSIPGILG